MTGWKDEELDHKPEELESDGTPYGYIQRKDIKKNTKKNDEIGAEYTCKMRFISVSEYEFLKAIQNAVRGKIEV